MVKFRGFIAIDIPSFPKILDLESEIKNTDADVKLVEPKNIHITLKFLGDTPEENVEKIHEIIKESVKDIKPFEIKFSNVGAFPNQNYIKVIWIGIQNAELISKIAQSIDEKIIKLGFEREKRPFSAHLTIGRVKTAKNKEKLVQILNKYQNVDFSTYNVESIILKKSELTPKGPIYTDLFEVKL